MKKEKVVGWGFESENGMVWAYCFESRQEAIAWVEKDVGDPWRKIQEDWGVNLIRVEVIKALPVVEETAKVEVPGFSTAGVALAAAMVG